MEIKYIGATKKVAEYKILNETIIYDSQNVNDIIEKRNVLNNSRTFFKKHRVYPNYYVQRNDDFVVRAIKIHQEEENKQILNNIIGTALSSIRKRLKKRKRFYF